MKYVFLSILLLVTLPIASQVKSGEFNMSNSASPAFMLVEESPTVIFVPDNLKALSIYAMDNLGKSLSLEINPYFFINTQRKGRTFYKYIGLAKDTKTSKIKQLPFSGMNTATTISVAYLDKEFSGIHTGKKKTYSIGLRTTILRFYNLERMKRDIASLSDEFESLIFPIPNGTEESKKELAAYAKKKEKILAKLVSNLKKTIKPVFRLDGAAAYSSLFKENTTNSDTANRFGAWLTAQGSMILNEGSDSKYNNYFNLLLTARYIDDGFNNNTENSYFKLHYLDFGGKIALDYNKFTFGYEFISRNGSITSSRSVGSISYGISKDIVITGGFGKDFSTTNENLLTVFGINWGLNIGKKNISL